MLLQSLKMSELECKICFEEQSPKQHHITECCRQNLCYTCWKHIEYQNCPFCRNNTVDIINLTYELYRKNYEYSRNKYRTITDTLFILYMLLSIFISTRLVIGRISNNDSDLLSVTTTIIPIFSIVITIGFVPFIAINHVIEYYMGLKKPGECKEILMNICYRFIVILVMIAAIICLE